MVDKFRPEDLQDTARDLTNDATKEVLLKLRKELEERFPDGIPSGSVVVYPSPHADLNEITLIAEWRPEMYAMTSEQLEASRHLLGFEGSTEGYPDSGSFMGCLVRAFVKADGENRWKLLQAYPQFRLPIEVMETCGKSKLEELVRDTQALMRSAVKDEPTAPPSDFPNLGRSIFQNGGL